MHSVLLVRLDWDRTAIPLREAKRYYTLRVSPEPEYPFGRKGLGYASAWRQLAGPVMAGMLVLDGDVAIDQHDTAAMLVAIDRRPEDIHVGPVKLWPASTKQDRWVHGHGKGSFSHHNDPDEVDHFGLSFTYLPRRLITACTDAGMDTWTYPHVDAEMRKVARKLRIPGHVVRDASPKHLNM